MAFVFLVGSSGRKFLYSSTSFSIASSCDCNLLRRLGSVRRMWLVSCWFSMRCRYGVPILSAMCLHNQTINIMTVICVHDTLCALAFNMYRTDGNGEPYNFGIQHQLNQSVTCSWSCQWDSSRHQFHSKWPLKQRINFSLLHLPFLRGRMTNVLTSDPTQWGDCNMSPLQFQSNNKVIRIY